MKAPIKDRLRVLLISPGGFGEQYHGPGTSLSRLFHQCPEQIRLNILHATPGPQNTTELSVEFVQVTKARRPLAFIFGASWFVVRHRSDHDVVLLAMCNGLTLVPGLIAKALGLPVILRAAASAELRAQRSGGIGNAVKTWLVRQATAHWAISSAIEQGLHAMVGLQRSVHYIPNSVDTNRFAPVSREIAAQRARDLGVARLTDLKMICVGAIGERKGQRYIIEALSQLPPEISLILVGPFERDADRTEIDSLIAEHRLHDRVTLVGHMSDIEKAYQAAQIFLLPSLGEGMPNSMLEAMSCSLLPLGTQVSGTDELVRDGCGAFVERDAVSIARTIQHYYSNRALLERERNRAREIVLAEYDVVQAASRVIDLLSSASRQEVAK